MAVRLAVGFPQMRHACAVPVGKHQNTMDDVSRKEFAWQKWQTLYATRRNEIFQRLIEARRSLIAEKPMKKATLLSNAPACVIELTHGAEDPGTWIIRHATRYMWFKKRISSHWFTSELQA